MMTEIDGVNLNYLLEGAGDEKVLLLHGWGCDSSFMQAIANALADHFQVLIPDFPGHGKSGRPPQPWGVPEYSLCLMHLLEKLHFFPCHVIAHSFGCRVAAWCAAERPSGFGKLVFTGAAGIRSKPTPEQMKKSARYKKLKRYCTLLGKIPRLGSVADRASTKIREKYGSKDYNALDEEMKKTFIKIINQDLTELYPKILSSTLLIWGEQDTETPLWMGKEMEKLIPDAGLVVFEGGSHFAYLEQNSRFNRIVCHFLKEEA